MEQVEQNNRLIAEFMGAVEDPPHPQGKIMYKLPWKHPSGFDDYVRTNLENLKYHKSWDWLMPVVQKIRLHYLANNYTQTGKRLDVLYANIKNSLGQANISYLYDSVIEYLKWYNENKQP